MRLVVALGIVMLAGCAYWDPIKGDWNPLDRRAEPAAMSEDRASADIESLTEDEGISTRFEPGTDIVDETELGANSATADESLTPRHKEDKVGRRGSYSR